VKVGGDDTAMINATWNTVACCLPVVVPFLGFWLREKTGSWLPQVRLSSLGLLLDLRSAHQCICSLLCDC
jgi:hypothetical protein